MDDFSGKRVTIAGLGRFGGQIAAARWLVGQGARVTVTDRDSAEKLADSVRQLDGLGVAFHLGRQDEADFTDADLVVASPAIPPGNPLLAAARGAGVRVTTEICLFVERCVAPVVGVTGTKGKSTTSAMLGKILGRKFRTWVGGNIGKSLLGELGNVSPTDVVVLELSSYMLDYLGAAGWSPHVALVTLVAADHLEWHGSEAAYLDAKRNIVRHQTANDYAVVSPSAVERGFARGTRARVVEYHIHSDRPVPLLVPGAHNQFNAQGALAAAKVLGLSWDDAAAALADFSGLPHRLALVHEAAGVRWYDDSIATIPGAAVAAIEAFEPGTVLQIVGGHDKGLPVDDMTAALASRAKAVLCIGESGDALADGVERRAQGAIVRRCGTMAVAVAAARALAAPGDVVLLSPGAASYDQFVNFEDRGETFARLARGG